VRTEDGVKLHVEVVEADVKGSRLTRMLQRRPPVTLVFAHGFCLDMGTFHFQRQALDGEYRMVFYDQPGHGRSGRLADGEYTLDSLGTALRHVIDEVVPTGRIVLIGHSMGGMTIMALA